MKKKKPKTRLCSGCNKRKKIKEFLGSICKNGPRKGHIMYRLLCKDCTAIERSKKKVRQRKLVSEYKASQGCKNCDFNDPRALILHHRDPNHKFKAIATLISMGYSDKNIKEEILKCDVLCANCHMILHSESPPEKRI